DFSGEKINSLEKLAHRIDDVCQIEVASGNFVQHGRKKEEVFAIDQRDLDVRVSGQSVVQMNGGMQAGKAATQYQDSSFAAVSHRSPFRSATVKRLQLKGNAYSSPTSQ